MVMAGQAEESKDLIEKIIKEAVEYHDGNEENDAIIDPLMFKAMFQMQ